MAEGNYPQYVYDIQYAHEHALQTADVTILRPREDSQKSDALWVIFLHGGAWNDPAQDKTEPRLAIENLLSSPDHKHMVEQIAGFASINYGLSPRPDQPNDAAERNFMHPKHLEDALEGIKFVAREYEMHRWMIIGHSCGATMLFQLAMKLLPTEKGGSSGFGPSVNKPVALCGLEGIYDLPLLVENHKEISYYAKFATNAFGPNQAQWIKVSPRNGDPQTILEDTKVCVIGHSREDELVEWPQVDVMMDRLRSADKDQKVKLLMLKGKHDEIWRLGTGLEKAIVYTVEQLQQKS